MLRSMYAGISGMKNFQTKLDVIGNNIANVNTAGFKKGRVTFQDMMSQTTSSAQGPTAARGGVNPSQVGLGSQLGSIDNIHTQGFQQTTNRTLDLALEGDGMFVVAGDTNRPNAAIEAAEVLLENARATLTAAQAAYNAAQTTLTTAESSRVTAVADLSVAEDAEEAAILANNEAQSQRADQADIDAVQVEVDTAQAALDALDPDVDAEEDIVAAEEALEVAQATLAELQATVDAALEAETALQNAAEAVTKAREILAEAELAVTNAEADVVATEVAVNTALTPFQAADANLKSLLNWDVNLDTSSVSYTRAGAFYLDQDGAIISPEGFYLVGFEKTSGLDEEVAFNYNSYSTITIPTDAQSFSIQTDGIVNYIDANGNPQVAGQVMLANFSNAAGLEKAGSNLYLASQNSGVPVYTIAETNGTGSMVAGSLEMSNVDLAEEFTEMIVAQRGFQANTRIISTSDEILQELVNLKR